MSSKASKQAGGAAKRKQAAAPQQQQPPQQQPHSDAEDDGAAGASAGAGAKQNRRAVKKAKLEAASVAAAAAAAELDRKQSRPAATQKRAAKRERAGSARAAAKEEEERELENFLFGSEEMLLKPMIDDEAEAQAAAAAPARKPVKRESADEEEDGAPEDDGEIAFEIDTTGAAPAVKDEDDEDGNKASKGRGRKGAAAVSAAASSSDAAAAPQAAWNDADDASHSAAVVDLSSAPRLRKLKTAADERFISGSEYSRRLRAVFTELNPGTAAWATLKPDASDADITSLLLQSATAGSAVGGGSGRAPGGASRGESLPATTLDLLRLKDANVADPSASILSSVRFHPNAQLLMTAGMDKMIRLFQIDGVTNTKVQGVWLEDLPIHAAEWLPSPEQGKHSAGEIVATGRRSHFYSIDVESSKVTRIGSIRGRDEKSYESMQVSPAGNLIAILGNDGHTMLLDARTKMLVGTLKQNGSVRGASFSSDGATLLTTGDEGTVYGWDVHSRKCVFKHADHGSISNTALAVAPSSDGRNEGFYACGADSGVVNLYNRSQLSDRLSSSAAASSAAARMAAAASRAPPAPLKSIMNLTTPIDLLRFNHDSSLLLMASRRKKDACKLVHVQSGTVFANWPTSSTPLHYLTSVDFSPNSGLMALGNDRGRVLLYRLTHYPRA